MTIEKEIQELMETLKADIEINNLVGEEITNIERHFEAQSEAIKKLQVDQEVLASRVRDLNILYHKIARSLSSSALSLRIIKQSLEFKPSKSQTEDV